MVPQEHWDLFCTPIHLLAQHFLVAIEMKIALCCE